MSRAQKQDLDNLTDFDSYTPRTNTNWTMVLCCLIIATMLTLVTGTVAYTRLSQEQLRSKQIFADSKLMYVLLCLFLFVATLYVAALLVIQLKKVYLIISHKTLCDVISDSIKDLEKALEWQIRHVQVINPEAFHSPMTPTTVDHPIVKAK